MNTFTRIFPSSRSRFLFAALVVCGSGVSASASIVFPQFYTEYTNTGFGDSIAEPVAGSRTSGPTGALNLSYTIDVSTANSGVDQRRLGFWANNTSNNTATSRYFRFEIDLRSGQGDIQNAGGTGQDTLEALDNDGDTVTLADDFEIINSTSPGSYGWQNVNSGDTFGQADAARFVSASLGTGATSGTPGFGFVIGADQLNWVLMRPDTSSGANSTLPFAVGFAVEDVDNSGKVNTGDKFILKYAFTATSASEIDTVAELNNVVPEPSSLLLGGALVGMSTGRRRRRKGV